MTVESTDRSLESPAAPQIKLSAQDQPLVGRMFEVRAAEELALAAKIQPDSEHVVRPVADPASVAAEPAQAEPPDEATLPFLGPVLNYVPGVTITVERRLNLEEDLYLADHAFVFAPGVKPMSACLPVLPMTMSLEAMAEVAACLVPGYGLLGFEDVKAARWIELVDTNVLTLNITARVDRHDPERGAYFIGGRDLYRGAGLARDQRHRAVRRLLSGRDLPHLHRVEQRLSSSACRRADL
jgi:hypothetical protein